MHHVKQPIHGLEQHKGISAIYPPSNGVIKCGCHSCNKDVNLQSGFADINKGPFKYLCSKCAIIAIGGNKAAELILFAQEKSRINRPT